MYEAQWQSMVAALPTPCGQYCRIESVVTLLKQKNPQTTVILMGLLPRGDGEQDGIYTQPNKYTQAISNVNAGLHTFASGLSQVQYIDCGPQLLPDGKVCPSCHMMKKQAAQQERLTF